MLKMRMSILVCKGPTVIKVADVVVTLSQTRELGNVGNVEHEPDLVLGLHLAAGGVQEVPSYLPNVLGGLSRSM